ncbi:MAG: hypothetical protein J1E85_06325 [Ruminococcus sp.]|nr:hypothetical protein [Ruminococcus sp.]
MGITYRQEYAEDEKILGSEKFTTCIYLTKNTFKKIDEIRAATHSESRSNIISAAVDYYYGMLQSGEYQKHIAERLSNG